MNNTYKFLIILGALAVFGIVYKVYFAGDKDFKPDTRKEQIERGFNSWDGSHINLTSRIKSSMNDPNSYEHVKTTYLDNGDYLIVETTFRGSNAFGGIVTQTVSAKVGLSGNVISLIE